MAKGKPVILDDYNVNKEDEEAFDFAKIFDEANDPSYIPGYSEQVKANEIGAADGNLWYEQRPHEPVRAASSRRASSSSLRRTSRSCPSSPRSCAT